VKLDKLAQPLDSAADKPLNLIDSITLLAKNISVNDDICTQQKRERTSSVTEAFISSLNIRNKMAGVRRWYAIVCKIHVLLVFSGEEATHYDRSVIWVGSGYQSCAQDTAWVVT